MKKFLVTVFYTTHVIVEVESESEGDAIDDACGKIWYDNNLINDFKGNAELDRSICEIQKISFQKQLKLENKECRKKIKGCH